MFFKGEPWNKTNGQLFDVTMGSYDGAEVCELVGLYLLQMLRDLVPSIDFGLYRDDGLGTYSNAPGPQMGKSSSYSRKITYKFQST